MRPLYYHDSNLGSVKSAVLAILIASAAFSGDIAISSLSDDLARGFECEDLFDGDRIEIQIEDAGAGSGPKGT